MNIYLVRHGQSFQNKSDSYIVPDELIRITKEGEEQAKLVGDFLQNQIIGEELSKSVIVSSTYMRAKQTAIKINESLGLKIFYDSRLREYKRGIFGKYTFQECMVRFPREFKKFIEELNGVDKFYARPPQGESAYDVTERIKPFKFALDELDRRGIKNVIIVSHSGAIRSFLCAVMGYDKDWYANERNMKNCSVRLLEKYGKEYIDNGYIYGGYRHKQKSNDNDKAK